MKRNYIGVDHCRAAAGGGIGCVRPRDGQHSEQRKARFGGSAMVFTISQALVYQQATDATQASWRISGTPQAHPCEARANW